MNEGTAADVTAAHGGRSRQSKKHSKTYRSISAILSWLTARRPTTLSTSLRARFLSYLLTLAIAWLPWLILTWPGSMRDDTLAQYLQSSGLHHYYTQHPLFDTLTFGLFWHIGSALGSPLIGQALYTVTQAVLLAAGCALLLCYIRKIGSPRWLIDLGLVYLATNYVVVGAITTMGKDSLHAVFYLPLAVLFVEACLTCGSVLARRPVAFAFVILLFATIVSKRTALIIVLCADYLFTPSYLRQWASFLTEGAWKHTSDGDADTVAAERLAAIEHDLAPLRGTSDKPQWQKNILRAIHRWVRSDGHVGVRKGNPLTSMALYVTWIPLAAGLALAVRPARRRYGPALAAYGLLAFTVLSLYASPMALFWYPIPVFLTLPLFVVLPFTFRESHPL